MAEKSRNFKLTDRISTRLKLKQLRLLVAISEHRSVLRAAEELNISQPAATKLLKDLEADFDVRLFDRTNRGVKPTEHGRALVRHGKLVLVQLSHAAQELDDLSEGLGGRVVVGTLLTASANILPKTINLVHRQRPNVSIVVREGTNDILMPLLRTGELDLVVGRLAEYRYRENITQEVLFQDRIVVVAGRHNALSDLDDVDFETLAQCDWILPPPETTLRRQVEKEFLDRGCPTPSNAVECVSFLTTRALLTSSNMLGVMPYHVVEREILDGSLKIIPCRLNISNGPVGVSLRSEDALSPAALTFLKQLREASGDVENAIETRFPDKPR